MLTFLNTKFGLKQLILDYAGGIVQAVKSYSSIDHEVLLFGKMLKNTVDEDFWITQENLRHTLQTQVKVCYRERFAMKPHSEVNKHSDEVIADKYAMDP